MSQTLLTITGGMGILIFAYLLFSNGPASVNLLNAGFTGTNSLVKSLQGR